MSICPNYLKIAHTTIGKKQALITRLRCKSWDCEYCAKKNCSIWQYWLIKRLPEVAADWWLMTLTAPHDKRSQLESLKAIRDNIERLIKRMKRVFGEGIEYVRVFEKHPTSEAIHAHFILTGVTPFVATGYSVKFQPVAYGVMSRTGRLGFWALKTWLKKTCQAIGMGKIADIEKIEGDIAKVAYYITAYLTKDMQAIHVAYLRHIQVTKGIGKPQFDHDYDWVPASYITTYTFEPGTEVKDVNTGFVIDNNYWEAKGFYPDDK